MKLTSSAFSHNASIPAKYTCDGDDVNPPLSISDVPTGTQSLALIVHDPDAPVGDWLHWIVWNIAPNTTEIHENSTPKGALEGITDFGRIGYGGPCPPSGTHRYFFELYALDAMLTIAEGAEKSALKGVLNGHVLGKIELIGLYERAI